MTDADSSTNTKPTMGKTKTELVKKATMAKVKPNDMAPVSPIKKRAGNTLNHKNANKAPMIVAINIASSIRPWTKAITPKAKKQNAKTPPASPSSPSVSLTEKDVATATKINSGIYQAPI